MEHNIDTKYEFTITIEGKAKCSKFWEDMQELLEIAEATCTCNPAADDLIATELSEPYVEDDEEWN